MVTRAHKKYEQVKTQSIERAKETTLERADFTLQLLMFVTAEKEIERVMFIIFFLFIFLSAVVPTILS